MDSLFNFTSQFSNDDQIQKYNKLAEDLQRRLRARALAEHAPFIVALLIVYTAAVIGYTKERALDSKDFVGFPIAKLLSVALFTIYFMKNVPAYNLFHKLVLYVPIFVIAAIAFVQFGQTYGEQRAIDLVSFRTAETITLVMSIILGFVVIITPNLVD